MADDDYAPMISEANQKGFDQFSAGNSSIETTSDIDEGKTSSAARGTDLGYIGGSSGSSGSSSGANISGNAGFTGSYDDFGSGRGPSGGMDASHPSLLKNGFGYPSGQESAKREFLPNYTYKQIEDAYNLSLKIARKNGIDTKALGVELEDFNRGTDKSTEELRNRSAEDLKVVEAVIKESEKQKKYQAAYSKTLEEAEKNTEGADRDFMLRAMAGFKSNSKD